MYILKYSTRLLVLLASLSYLGCTDLEVEEVESVVTEDESGNFSGNPTDLLRSAYDQLSVFVGQADVYSLYQHTSDEMIPPTRGTDWGDNGVWRLLHTHNWDATHQYVLNSWNQMNGRAFLTNQVLASSPTPEQEAEAKFLRGFYTWHVMDLFGQVPFREVNQGVDEDPVVLSRAEAFDAIVRDLEEALPVVPSMGPSNSNTNASKAAVNTMLARLYLNRGVYTATVNEDGLPSITFNDDDMNLVVQYCDAVTTDGYSLAEDYYSNFASGGNDEVIFASPEGNPETRYRMTLHYDSNPDGWNGFTTLADFYAKF